MIKYFEPNKYYIYDDGDESCYCIFKTYEGYGTLCADDIFTKDNQNSKNWYPDSVYYKDEYQYITEIDPDDYPEYFI